MPRLSNWTHVMWRPKCSKFRRYNSCSHEISMLEINAGMKTSGGPSPRLLRRDPKIAGAGIMRLRYQHEHHPHTRRIDRHGPSRLAQTAHLGDMPPLDDSSSARLTPREPGKIKPTRIEHPE